MNVAMIVSGAGLNERTRAVSQRLRLLTQRGRVVLFIPEETALPPELADQVQTFVCPFRSWVPLGAVGRVSRYMLFTAWAVQRIRSLWRETGIDLLYTFQSYGAEAAFLASHLFGIKWIIELHHTPFYLLDRLLHDSRKQVPKIIAAWLFCFLSRRILARADLILALAHDREGVQQRLKLSGLRVLLGKAVPVRMAIDLDYVRRSVGQREVHPRATIRLFYVGHITPFRAQMLLGGFKRVKDRIGNLELLLVGSVEEEFRATFAEMTAKLEGVKYLGYRGHAECLRIMNEADVCIFVAEPWVRDYHLAQPNKILEALALGKPVVAADFPGVRGLVEHGGNGWLFDPRSVEAFSEGISVVASDVSLRRKMGERSLLKAGQFDLQSNDHAILGYIDGLFNAAEPGMPNNRAF